MRKNFITLLVLCSLSSTLAARDKVTLSALQDDWARYQNREIEISTTLIVCGNYYDSLILAPERLYCPEERAAGLAEGDSTDYYRIKAYNHAVSLCLHCRNDYYDVRTGDRVKNLKARVTAPRQLLTGNAPNVQHLRKAALPRRAKGEIRIVGANIENYFADLGGYASKKTTPDQLKIKTRKIVKALRQMRGDIYALCEMQQGNHAPLLLLQALNHGGRHYAYVETGWENKDHIGACFIYRTDRVQPYGEWMSAYRDTASHYYPRMIAQAFEQLDKKGNPTGKKLIVSVNHFKSKSNRNRRYDTNAKRMENADSLIAMLPKAVELFGDSDVLLLGDYNCYTQEQPIRAIVRAGYEDMLQLYCPDEYSYSYHSEVGWLDRCFATPSMRTQVVNVTPWHVNTDWYYSHGAYKMRDKSCHRYADHDPIIVDVRLK
ncbi:MAG: hypothetical protein IJ814_05855 [Paludibacteraceae bacterium]|nr:hypothetical protein [Paludibacteraceae bacterium]